MEFNFEEIPTTDAYNQKIKLLISSGDLPDIVFNGGNNITELAAKSGKVADLTPYFEKDPEWKALFDETSLEFNTVDGKIYGVPVSKEISYIYYNKELFEEAGIQAPDVAYATWDEFFEVCDKLKASGITPLGMDTADSGWLTNLWMSALIGTNGESGNEWMNTMYPTDFNIPEVEEAAEMVQKMFAEAELARKAGDDKLERATLDQIIQMYMWTNDHFRVVAHLLDRRYVTEYLDKMEKETRNSMINNTN